jgi:hypothetical protein
MMRRELPARPNLEQLKKQAKSLLHAAQARDGEGSAALPPCRRFPANPSTTLTQPIWRFTMRSL